MKHVFGSESARKDVITLGNMGISTKKNTYKNAYRVHKSRMTKKKKGNSSNNSAREVQIPVVQPQPHDGKEARKGTTQGPC
jgi:hypothetical protein